MPKINLLPWREELRRERQKEFGVQAFLAALLGVAVAGYGWFTVNGMINHQERRNAYLQEQIKLVDEQIKEINDLQETKQRLLARMQVIEQLQQARPGIVHLFDELVRTVPDGVYLTSIKQTGENIEITGVAESSARVSSYMRNIDASEWLTTPTLNVIETREEGRSRSFSFALQTKQTSPNAEDGETAGNAP